MAMVEQNRPRELNPAPGEAPPEPRQRRQMLVALALLMAALILVLYKDWQFWFPEPTSVESEVPGVVAPTSAQPDNQAVEQEPPLASTKSNRHAPAPAPTHAKAEPAGPVQPMVTTSRAVLPPLQVEVVAGDSHRTVQPGSNSVKVDLQPNAPTTAATDDSGRVASAAERVRLSADTTAVVSRSVEPDYPLLAKQMKVQGAVILQALIGKEGEIQDLRVLSGPTILSSAAREAVKQWRFKPYLQSGQAVETEARITVNFTISTY